MSRILIVTVCNGKQTKKVVNGTDKHIHDQMVNFAYNEARKLFDAVSSSAFEAARAKDLEMTNELWWVGKFILGDLSSGSFPRQLRINGYIQCITNNASWKFTISKVED